MTNDLPYRFDGGSKPPPYGEIVSYFVTRTKCRGVSTPHPPLRGPSMRRMRASPTGEGCRCGGSKPPPYGGSIKSHQNPCNKKDGYTIRPFKRRPRSRALRAPSGFDSVPPVSFLSDTSYRATARNEPSRTAMRHRAKRRWNLGRDSAQNDTGGFTPNNIPFPKVFEGS